MSDLVPRFVLGDLDLTDYPFGLEFGSDLGNPENVSDILASLLADGEVESLSGRSNRTLVIPLLIEEADIGALNAAEKMLIAECDKQQNTLSIDPGDDTAPVSVFETFSAQPARQYDDDLERSGFRRWVLTIKALPYARSDTLIVDDAGTPPSGGGTLLYNCQSTTGWTTYGGLTTPVVDTTIFTEGTGSLRSQANYPLITNYPSYSVGTVDDKVEGLSLSTGTGGYLSIAVRTEWTDAVGGTQSRLQNLYTQVGGVWTEVATYVAARVDAAGFVHYVWPVDAGVTVTGLRMIVTQFRLSEFPHPPYVWYDDVELLPAATTDHQIVKQIVIQGSARTTGSLRVSAPSDVIPLGRVLAITTPTSEIPAGFQPDGRRWITQGTTTSDATALGGSYLTPDTVYSTSAGYPIFDVPVGMLTAGPYTVVALVKAEASTLTFGVQAQLRVGSTNLGPTSAAEVSPTGLTTGWQFITVGTVYLPPLPVQNADATTKVRLLFKGAKMADVFMIPAWQVGGRPVADFSIVDCGTGTVSASGASSSLWINTPSLTNPQGSWLRGPTADGSNAISAWADAKKPGVHTLAPGPLSAYLVSTGAAGPTLAVSYYDRHFGLVAWPTTEAS